MSLITYRSERVASRWRLVRWEIFQSVWGYCILVSYNYLAHQFFPHFSLAWPKLFEITAISIILFIILLVFPRSRFYVNEVKVNEMERFISIRYYHPYDGYMDEKIPFDQLQVRLSRNLLTNKISQVELFSKKTGALSIESGRYSLSSREIEELGNLLESITFPKNSRKGIVK